MERAALKTVEVMKERQNQLWNTVLLYAEAGIMEEMDSPLQDFFHMEGKDVCAVFVGRRHP